MRGLAGHARRLTSALAVTVIAALVCLMCAWITGAETWRQYVLGVETITAFPISKWWVSIFIPYGLLNSGIHFLRQYWRGDDLPARSGDTPVVPGGSSCGASRASVASVRR